MRLTRTMLPLFISIEAAHPKWIWIWFKMGKQYAHAEIYIPQKGIPLVNKYVVLVRLQNKESTTNIVLKSQDLDSKQILTKVGYICKQLKTTKYDCEPCNRGSFKSYSIQSCELCPPGKDRKKSGESGNVPPQLEVQGWTNFLSTKRSFTEKKIYKRVPF